MRLEIGAGYHTDWDRAAEQIVQYIMVPNFKKGDVNGGVTAGVRTMIARITTNIANGRPATASPFENPIAQSAPTEQFRLVGQDDGASPGGTLDWLWYSLVVPVLGGGALFTRRIYRMRPRDCVKCGTRMKLLDEAADDAFLDEGSQLEESIKSVDYDVWQCPSCAPRPYRTLAQLVFAIRCVQSVPVPFA